MLSIIIMIPIGDGEPLTQLAWLLVRTSMPKYNTFWTYYPTAVIAALLLVLSCCLVTRRRRRFAQTTNPNVKPPLFGTAPPGYSLPFWNNNQSTPAQGASQGNHAGGTEGHSTTDGYQYPPPMTHATSNPPPPPYGKADGTDTKGPYPPVSSTSSSYLRLTNIIPACRSASSGAYYCKPDCLHRVCITDFSSGWRQSLHWRIPGVTELNALCFFMWWLGLNSIF
jgi:hypothetical protein